MNGPPKFQVIDEPYNVFIRDTENQLNFCHLCESGFGLNSKSRRLAEKNCRVSELTPARGNQALVKSKINPAWEDAKYEVHFLVGLSVPSAVRAWSRKRRMRWIRRKTHGYIKSWFPGTIPNPVFDSMMWKGEEVFRCPACEGDVTEPHTANCNYPFTVALAWRRLYGKWPNCYEWCAILCHDLGYWGCPNMDGPEGREHPVKGAIFAGNLARRVNKLFGCKWFDRDSGLHSSTYHAIQTSILSVTHSREYSKRHRLHPSKLCWADKFCCFYDPPWFYLLRGHLSGEIHEFRANARGLIPDSFSFSDWYRTYRLRVLWLPEIQSLLALPRRSCIFPF